jgi:enamine deaminase RidA (YjgF/YER057c/UK114 family)
MGHAAADDLRTGWIWRLFNLVKNERWKMKQLFAIGLLSMGVLSLGAASVQGAEQKNFHFVKPEGLFNNPRYSHVVTVDKGKLIYLAGEMPLDEKGQLVGKGDFKAQVVRTWDNILLALKAEGLDMSDVIKINSYVVDLPANNAAYREARAPYMKEGVALPAATSIGVTALAVEGQLLEVEVIAVSRH